MKTLVPLNELDKNRFKPVKNKMEAEFKLRKWLFKDYNPNLKPSEMPGAEIIIKISIVIDQILELTIKQESLVDITNESINKDKEVFSVLELSFATSGRINVCTGIIWKSFTALSIFTSTMT